MKFLKDKKFQMGALLVLLVAVIAIGSWWFMRPQGQEEDAPPPEVSGAEDASVLTDREAFLSDIKPRPYSIVREEAAEAELSCYGIVSELFYYEGQFCCFHAITGADLAIEVVSMLDGETLRTYTSDDFYNQDTSFTSLYMDYDGTLWALYELDHDPAHIRIAPCKSGVTEAEVLTFDLSAELDEPVSPTTFAVWGNFAVIHSGTRIGDTYYYSNQMLLIDTSSNEIKAKFNNIWRFCLDESGNLYYVTDGSGDDYYQDGVSHVLNDPWGEPYEVLAKYSQETAEQLWTLGVSDMPFLFPQALSCTPEGELFLGGTSRGPGGIFYWIDTETGGVSKEMADFLLDVTDPPDDILALSRSASTIDGQYRIYLLRYDIAPDGGPSGARLCSQKQFVLEPEVVEVSAEDRVILTITAPYRLDTIVGAIKLYQRHHPGAKVLWDTDYTSEEEFYDNLAEYKERFALRAMTGDLGDIVMLGGMDLSLDIVTGTDAFADLSGYLEQSSVKEEIPWTLMETMRGKDGAIRGIPVGIIPSYRIWNEELLKEYDIDPYTVTWSRLLDLALQWQAEGTDLSLATLGIAAAGTQRYVTAVTLRDILLANLQSGKAELDTPELRALLTKFRALIGSDQLVRSGGSDSNGSGKALIMLTDMTMHGIDKIHELCKLADKGEFTPFAAPLPLGEDTELRQGYAYCWGVSGSSRQKDGAWEFLESLIGPSGLPLNAYGRNILSVNTAAQKNWLDPWASDFKGWGIGEYYETYFYQIQDTMTVPYARFDEPEGFEAVYDAIFRYCMDEISLDQALEEAETSWERYLEE